MTSRFVGFAIAGLIVIVAPAAGAQATVAAPAATPAPTGQVPSAEPPPSATPIVTTPPAASPTRYDGLLERVKAGDTGADLGELREAFTETPAYRAMMMASYQPLWTPLNRGDFATALQTAEKVLGTNFVEINAHMVASVAHQQLGNPERAQFHRDIANGLLRVVMSKGDGATADTPWVVIDISEEYAIMRALGLSMQSQGLIQQGGANLDRLETIDPRTKTPRILFFNVDRSMAAMSGRRAGSK